MYIRHLAATLLLGVVATEAAVAVVYEGIDFPYGDASFADAKLLYAPGFGGGNIPNDPKYVNPDRALGPPDYVPDAGGSGGEFNGTGAVALGDGGRLELQFTDNVATNGGGIDLVVFERGVAEAFQVAVRPANSATRALLAAQCPTSYCVLGTVMPVNDVVQFDFDAVFTGFGAGTLRFDAVQLTDDLSQGAHSGDQVGPDIDAVGAVSADAIACGDGRVEGGETCDDGDVIAGDGCSATCRIEACWACSATDPSVCAIAPGSPCDDGEPCTLDDVCGGPSGLTCIGGPPPSCEDDNDCTDDSCVPGLGCRSVNNDAPCDDGSSCSDGDRCQAGECVGAAVESSGCRIALGPSQLRLLNRVDDDADALVWTWPNGEETSRDAFAAPPLPGGSYELCVFDSGPLASRRLRATARADKGQACAQGACWRLKGQVGYLFKNPPAPLGMRQLLLKSGAAGKAKIVAKGRGAALHFADDMTLTLPARVELRDSGSGECWEATYTDALRNDGDRFKAKQ